MSSRSILTLSLGSLAAAVASAGWLFGLATGLEAISFITGAIGVWLTVVQSAWNFPIGLINVATFSVVFFDAKLYADAGLQVVYFGLILIGWYLWVFGGENRTKLQVSPTRRGELAFLSVFLCGSTLVLWKSLSAWGGSASFWDALTTSMSLVAQWLLNRKKIESWLFWIAVDLIYVPLYLYKGLYLTAILYGIFLGMAAIGFKEWRKSL